MTILYLFIALIVINLIIFALSPGMREVRRIRKEFYEKGYSKYDSNTVFRIDPGNHRRLLEVICLRKNGQKFYVVVTAQGWFKIKNVKVGELIELID